MHVVRTLLKEDDEAVWHTIMHTDSMSSKQDRSVSRDDYSQKP